MEGVKELQIQRPERYLVRSLLANWDEADAAVIGDWCEERGFVDVAAALREGPTRDAWNRLNALAICLGLSTQMAMAPPPPGSWELAAIETGTRVENVVVGFPAGLCRPRENGFIVETSIVSPCRVQRLIFGATCVDAFLVHRIRFGPWDVLVNCDPVPARLIDGNDPSLPDFSARVIDAGAPLVLHLENITDAPVTLSLGARCQILYF